MTHTARTVRPTGIVIWEGPSPIDGAPIALIATGIGSRSHNRKTGDMVQTWVMRRDIDPVAALKAWADGSVCGDCRHRGQRADDGSRVGRSCYVTVFQGPLSVWRTYAAGRYPRVTPEQAADIFAGRHIRLGAYGDPGAIPLDVLGTITSKALPGTGYTHMWRRIDPAYSDLLMASGDTVEDRRDARRMGYRTFFVAPVGSDRPAGAMLCSAARESNPLQCADCLACGGTRNGTTTGVDVYITAHGPGARYV